MRMDDNIEPSLEEEFRRVINRRCVDVACNTPDYILADLVVETLASIEAFNKKRDEHGR